MCSRGGGRHLSGRLIQGGGGEEGDIIAVKGDSRGPMVSRAEGEGGYSVIGITSWGDGCAVEGTFGVYTRVGYHMQWVVAQFGYSGETRYDYCLYYYTIQMLGEVWMILYFSIH